MKRADHAKMCLSCEAGVSYEATYCPFCGADLLETSASEEDRSGRDERFAAQSLEESLASLYKPPYSVRNHQGIGVPDEREKPSFTQVSPPKEDPLFQTYATASSGESSPTSDIHTEETSQKRGGVWPLLLLSIGLNLVVLGLLIVSFSKGGIVRLEWSARFWFLYLLFGLPMVYFGIRSLKQCMHSDETTEPNGHAPKSSV